MEIRQVATYAELESLIDGFAQLDYRFGGMDGLGEEGFESREAWAVLVDGEVAAYLTAQDKAMWCVETHHDHRGKGYARTLVAHAGIRFAWEVCSDDGAALCDALGLDYEDCR